MTGELPRPCAFRVATEADLVVIVEMLANDPLGAFREDSSGGVSRAYRDAFQAIGEDPNHQLLVCDMGGAVAGVLQLSFIPHLTYKGGWRAQVEGVRVREDMRSRGVGKALIDEAVRRAEEKGCHLVQLTTDKRRPDALRFYVERGFVATHEGMKLHLSKE